MQRCGALIVVSDFTPIPDSGPVKVLLVKVLRMLKKSVGEKGDEDSVIELCSKHAPNLKNSCLVKILLDTYKESFDRYDPAWILDQWSQRQGRSCPYCKECMSFEKSSPNKVTVNRLNNDFAHIVGNIELCCKRCNNSTKNM